MLWVVASSVYLYVWGFSDYGYFDQHNNWLGLTDVTTQQAALLEHLEQVKGLKAGQRVLVHIRQPGCRCNTYAERHTQDLLAGIEGAQITLTVHQAKALQIPIPATPMVAVFVLADHEQLELVYAGPYASGPFCAADDSFLPAVLDGSIDMSGPWFNGGVKACRCAVAS